VSLAVSMARISNFKGIALRNLQGRRPEILSKGSIAGIEGRRKARTARTPRYVLRGSRSAPNILDAANDGRLAVMVCVFREM
jgi:hypothetical protein